jgi:periplasmic copper chaperone A
MGAISSIHHRAALAMAFAAVLTAPVAAAPGSLTIRNAWTRPAAAGVNGAGYFTVVNTGQTADRLVAALSPAAARVSIHESRLVGSVMTMRTLDGVAIPARASVVFKPGGLHLMLEGLEAPLKAGDRVSVTLVFARAGRTAATFTVANGPPGPAMAGMKM